MKKNRLSIRSKRFFYFSVTSLVLISACSIEEPKLPKWFVDLRIPIPQADWTMEEATDDSNIVLDTTLTGTTFLEIMVVDSLDRQTVAPEDMAVLIDPDSNGDHIDDIDLGNLGPIYTDSIPTASVLGLPLVPGTTIDVPGGTITLPDQQTGFPTYLWAHAKSGQMTLELVNNTFLNLNSGCQITVRDTNLNLLGVADFPDPINAYSSGNSTPIDLAGITFINQFLLTIRLPVQAEQDHPVTSQDSASSLWVVARINDLIVYESECILPPQVIDMVDSSSMMDQRHHIYWAVIDHGRVNVDIENRLEVPANIRISMPNIHDNFTGDEFNQSYHLDPLAVQRETLTLDGLRIEDHPDPNSGQLINYLLYDIYAETDSSEDLVHISDTDSILVKVFPESVYFAEVNGVLDTIDVKIDPVQKTDLFDASRIKGRVYLDSLSLSLNLYNETNIPINMRLNIRGSNNTQTVIMAPISLIVPRAEDGGVVHKVLTINDPHPNIVDLMGILPSDIRIEGTAFVEGSGQISTNQAAWGDYEIVSPLYIRLPGKLIITSEKDSVDADSAFKSNVYAMSIKLNAYNGLPLSAQSVVYIGVDSTNLFTDVIADSTTKCIIRDLNLQHGVIGTTGYVEEPWEDQIGVTLNEQQLNVFKLDTTLYVGTKIIVDSTNTLVKFRPSDLIRVNGFLHSQYLMKNEKDEEK